MYLTDKLKIFVGKLLCAEDHSELKFGNESSEKSLSLSLFSYCT